MLTTQPQKHVIYLTDRVHLLYHQAALFSSQLGFSVGRCCLYPLSQTSIDVNVAAGWVNFVDSVDAASCVS